ncbi:MAG: sugar transferase [Planctomycetia bacterium]|nr:sugar transferase [Planctomycetia bacterium]
MIRLTNLFRRRGSSTNRADWQDTLHSVDRMRAILERERMRADRGNSSFALVTFTFPGPCNDATLSTLARILGERLRATDDAGLMSPRRVGIVLPETPAAGAWTLAERICELLPADMARPECDVYVYPSTQEQPGLEAASEDAAEEDGREALPMQVLFAQPLPGWKRAIDVIVAGTALVVAAPLLVIVAVAIKLSSPGPIFFRQRRHTIGGRGFTMYKFRTMCVDAEAQKASLRQFSEQDGPAFKMKHDPRITRLGRVLRSTSIDELPQLFNVLLGDMSLVGPRPLPCDESRRCTSWQQRRLDVTPGLTCIWQVRGRSKVSFADWIRMDIQYIRSRSLANDVKLIAQTVPAVVLRRGAC